MITAIDNTLMINRVGRMSQEECLMNELSWRLNYTGLKDGCTSCMFVMVCTSELALLIAKFLHDAKRTDNYLFKTAKAARYELNEQKGEFKQTMALINYLSRNLTRWPRDVWQSAWLATERAIADFFGHRMATTPTLIVRMTADVLRGKALKSCDVEGYETAQLETWFKDVAYTAHKLNDDMSVPAPTTITAARKHKAAYLKILERYLK